MPDSTGFGDYTETGQVIPVSFHGRKGGYTHCMFLNDDPPIAGGRELWGFPKKLANPTLRAEIDTLVGTLDYGPVRVATGTMGYKHKAADLAAVKAALEAPNFLLKIIPHVDGTPRICELVEYHLEDIDVKGAWTGPGALDLQRPCAGAGCRAAGARGRLRNAHLRRPDPRARQGRPRLSATERSDGRTCMRLKDKVAIVTGAASGIGKEIATPSCAKAPRSPSPISIRRAPTPPRRSSAAPARAPSASPWT